MGNIVDNCIKSLLLGTQEKGDRRKTVDEFRLSKPSRYYNYCLLGLFEKTLLCRRDLSFVRLCVVSTRPALTQIPI